MPVRLIESLATTDALAELFSDTSVLRAMLDFEVGLARAQARVGLLPREAAEAIAAVAKPESFDVAKLAQDALVAGALAIPLVKALTERVRVSDPTGESLDRAGAGQPSHGRGLRALGRDQSGRLRYRVGPAAQAGAAHRGIRSLAFGNCSASAG